MKVFTFWEGIMPDYVKMCIDTWKCDFEILNYWNLKKFTDLKVDDKLRRFTLPQQADVIRVHLLRDNGGYWLDADTIMVEDELPKENIAGDPVLRTNSIGYLHAEAAGSDMFTKWAAYQDKCLDDENCSHSWDIMGNVFTNDYVKEHPEITIRDIKDFMPELRMIQADIPRNDKYENFYFKETHYLSDIAPAEIIMLHNSWTPTPFRKADKMEIMRGSCTLSNILRRLARP